METRPLPPLGDAAGGRKNLIVTAVAKSTGPHRSPASRQRELAGASHFFDAKDKSTIGLTPDSTELAEVSTLAGRRRHVAR
jgi:hypothetical protein